MRNFMQFEYDQHFFKVLDQAQSWAQQAGDLGWLKNQEMECLARIDRRSPATLFRQGEQRPLIVAFFGGTGVGKSTLLNRLAGHPIAQTGVVRPTSREVSLYAFSALALDRLKERFPIEKVRIAKHDNPEMKQVLWIDMPDIDSIEKSNREIVFEWLPHIDILIYVVSPERYHDERGWRMLLSEGARHAWLFVMNYFDHGDSSQLEAFAEQLAHAGFEDPIVYATDCSNQNSSTPDEFRQLHEIIEDLANQHTIEQLESRNLDAHLYEISNQIDRCIESMGSAGAIETLLERWESIWNKAVEDLKQGMHWPLQEIAGVLGNSGGQKNLLKQLRQEVQNEQPALNPLSTNPIIWDDWAQTRFDDALDQVTVTAAANGIPLAALNQQIEQIRPQAKKILHSQTEQSLRRSLANPGNSVQRFLLGLTRICSGLFPLAAIVWVAFEILYKFHHSSLSGSPYLGTNFAVHSTLLIFISWLLPWFLYRKIKPSTEEVALKALHEGTDLGFECIKSRIDELIANLLNERACLIDAARSIKQACELESIAATKIQNRILDRMLIKPQVLSDG